LLRFVLRERSEEEAKESRIKLQGQLQSIRRFSKVSKDSTEPLARALRDLEQVRLVRTQRR
jgi:hypothetical protein